MSKTLKRHRLVEAVEDDRRNDNGWWCYLKPGWINTLTDTHCVHEDTVRECLDQLANHCEPCKCGDCEALI